MNLTIAENKGLSGDGRAEIHILLTGMLKDSLPYHELKSQPLSDNDTVKRLFEVSLNPKELEDELRAISIEQLVRLVEYGVSNFKDYINSEDRNSELITALPKTEFALASFLDSLVKLKILPEGTLSTTGVIERAKVALKNLEEHAPELGQIELNASKELATLLRTHLEGEHRITVANSNLIKICKIGQKIVNEIQGEIKNKQELEVIEKAAEQIAAGVRMVYTPPVGRGFSDYSWMNKDRRWYVAEYADFGDFNRSRFIASVGAELDELKDHAYTSRRRLRNALFLTLKLEVEGVPGVSERSYLPGFAGRLSVAYSRLTTKQQQIMRAMIERADFPEGEKEELQSGIMNPDELRRKFIRDAAAQNLMVKIAVRNAETENAVRTLPLTHDEIRVALDELSDSNAIPPEQKIQIND